MNIWNSKMNQLELAKKIKNLRKEKGITEVELAIRCGIKEDVLRKIENDQKIPSPKVLQLLSQELEYQFELDDDSNAYFWLVTLHLSNFFCSVIIPLIIWLWKKENNHELDVQGKDVINFQISMVIYFIASAILVFVWIGMIFLFILGWYLTIITIVNTIKVVNGKEYSYPFSIKFLK